MICGFDLVVLQGGLLCGAVLAVIMPCFVVLWVCFFFFFFFSCYGLVVMVVVAVDDGRVVVVGAVDVFLDSGIYYFSVVIILFYCDVYIILLC